MPYITLTEYISKLAAEVDTWEEISDNEISPVTERSPGTQRSPVSGDEPYLTHEGPDSAPFIGDIDVLEPASLDEYGKDAIDVARSFWNLESAADTISQILRSNDREAIESQDTIIQLHRARQISADAINQMLNMYGKHNPELREYALQVLMGGRAWKV